MRSILLLAIFTFTIPFFYAQVAVLGISPQSIAGSYSHTWAQQNNGWTCPNLGFLASAVEDTIVLVNDGTPGTNLQGNPISGEGCTNNYVNSVNGKIAVIYRNTCEIGLKAYYAQIQGAVGVIIVNNVTNQLEEMTGGLYGNNVNIPVVMVDLSDGAALISSSQQQPTIVRIGTVNQYFAHNLSLNPQETLIPKQGMIPISLAQNGNEFNFHVGTQIANNGNQLQTGVVLNAKVLDPNNNIVYNHSVNNLNILAGEALTLNSISFPSFQLPTYQSGQYKLVYQVTSSNPDQWPQNNILEYPFSFTNNILSYSPGNPGNQLPAITNYFQPSGGGAGASVFQLCSMIKDPNASRVTANGIYFSVQTSNSYVLSNQDTIQLKFYEWNNPFYSLTDPILSYDSLNLIGSGDYIFTSNLQAQNIYGAFTNNVLLEDNQRYLACIQTTNPNIYFGHSNTNYSRNLNYYGQPLFPYEFENEWLSYGFYGGLANSLGIKLVPVPCPPPFIQYDTVLACQSYTGPSGDIYTQSGMYEDIIFNENGCDSIITVLTLTVINSGGSFSATICQGESYNWNGNLYTQSGQYTQTFTNQTACDSVVTLNLSVIPNSSNPTFTSSQTIFTSPPFNVQFSNTSSAIGYTYFWDFGDGNVLASNNASVSHEYAFNGQYTVSLIATNQSTGCTDTLTLEDFILCTGGNSCSHNSVISQSSPQISCQGTPVLLSCNSNVDYTYQWRKNGVLIFGSDSDSLLVTEPGTYTVNVIYNNCPVESNEVLVQFLPQPDIPVITSTGTITPCVGGSITLSLANTYSTYSWSNGASSSSTTTSTSGDYTVTVGGGNGCTATSTPFVVNASFLTTPNICLVGLDTINNHNRITWEKPLVAGIDSFYVYKETNVSNNYTLIGATDYNDTAVFVDVNSNPAVQAYRYKIAMLDSCGSETNLSDFHKTIHLTINQGLGGSWNLIWSHYEGIDFGSYNIYRGTNVDSVTLLTTIQSNLNSYTDLTPPAGILHYQIEVVNPNDCDPTKINDYGVSRSNIANNGLAEINESMAVSYFTVSPNPTHENLTLHAQEYIIGKHYWVTDAFGRILQDGVIENAKQLILCEDFSNGSYYLRVEEIPQIVKFVKQ